MPEDRKLPAPILKCVGLSYGPPGEKSLRKDLNVELCSGQLLLISGPNGCGKTTLLKVFAGILAPQAGKLTLAIPPSKIGYLPQSDNLACHLPLTLRDVLAISHAESRDLVDPKHFDLAWNTASGGEKKRTLLARVLSQQPSLLILDEPMNHLDCESRGKMLAALREFLQPPGERAAILVTHGGLTPHERTDFDTQELPL